VSGRLGDFLDTNILVYAFSTDPRSRQAEALLGSGSTISVQGLNEFANVARRKLSMSWMEIDEALSVIRTLCGRIVSVDIETNVEAMRLASRYQFSVFDAVMVACAIRADCDSFWSEDLQSGMVIDDRLTIRNPFS
jgi:predicted nucleic acid-binding protein